MNRQCYDAILSVLRNPDEAQNCFQSFYQHKLHNESFQLTLAAVAEDGRTAYACKCAINFARGWRRKLARDHARTVSLDPSLAAHNPHRNLERDIIARLDRGESLSILMLRAGEILDELYKHGNGRVFVRAVIDRARERGLDDWQTLLAVYWATDCAERAGDEEEKNRYAVNAHRVRDRLRCLQPFLRGERDWPKRIRL